MKPTERDMERAKAMLMAILAGHTANDSIMAVVRALAEVRAETWREAADGAEGHTCGSACADRGFGSTCSDEVAAALRAKAEGR